jgi:phage shock protein B
MEGAEALFVFAIVSVVIISIFVVLPWMILHYISKSRASGRLTEDDERMLEDLWRSARTMERRIETLERLVEPDASPARPRPTQSTRGDIN